MSKITAARRPSEIVRDYIEAKFLRPEVSSSARLPTIHEFATNLGVSPSTVRVVFKTLAEEGRLEAIPGKGTFLISQSAVETAASHNCLGINLALESATAGWSGAIFLGATNEALRANMMITALDTARMPRPGLEDIRKAISRVDGVIVFPSSRHVHEIDKVCREKKMPLVHINPTRFHATSNFISNDFFGSAYNLALALRETGRRKIVLVMSCSVNGSVSAAQIFSAFSLAFAPCRDAHLDVLEGEGHSDSVSREAGHALMSQYLRKHGSGKVDAVYGFGDSLAEGAAQALMEAGKKLPKDVSVIGGTGLHMVRAASDRIVAMQQPMQKIGEAAVRMLIWRIQNRTLDSPGIYLMPELGEGTTMRPEERQTFHRLLAQEKGLL